jgi:putative transposase
VSQVGDWPHSSFHRYVKKGIYPADWGTSPGVLAGIRE